MVTKCKNKITVSGIFLLCILFIASCANLPTKVDQKPVVDISEDDTTGENDEEYMIRNDSFDNWSSDYAGPTVTPIVLSIESAGEEGSLIIRQDPVLPEDSEISYSYDSSSDSGIQVSTPVPTAYSGAMKDEMAVAGFSPVNGAVVLPNQSMHMDVTLKNTGTTTWQTSYKVVDISGNPLTVLREYNLPYAVAPEGTVLLSIYMTSPAELGSYTSNFLIQDAYGVKFGEFAYTLTVGSFSSITEIPTLTATITPTYYSADGITATPDSLAWMCIDPERSKLQDCYSFCAEYSDRDEFRYCFYDGVRYTTPVP